MKYFILFISVLFSSISFAQLSSNWLGHYSGELKSISFKGDSVKYHMELDISEKTDSSYHFTIIYGEDSLKQERKYTLINNGPHQFKLDEQNSIVLDMSVINGTLYSIFEVQNALLHVSYSLIDNGMLFELTSSTKSEETGGKTDESGNEMPLVQSYKTTTYQIAKLKKLP